MCSLRANALTVEHGKSFTISATMSQIPTLKNLHKNHSLPSELPNIISHNHCEGPDNILLKSHNGKGGLPDKIKHGRDPYLPNSAQNYGTPLIHQKLKPEDLTQQPLLHP
jgi:hypothetical protein